MTDAVEDTMKHVHDPNHLITEALVENNYFHVVPHVGSGVNQVIFKNCRFGVTTNVRPVS